MINSTMSQIEQGKTIIEQTTKVYNDQQSELDDLEYEYKKLMMQIDEIDKEVNFSETNESTAV